MALQHIGEEIWIADGPKVPFYGFPYPTRMAVIRLADGGLWVWSPVGLDRELRTEVEALGPVRHLVSPNKLHHLFLAEWGAAWPEARLYAPPGLARRRKDLDFAAELGDRPEPAWDGQIDQVVIGGSLAMNEVVFFHRQSSTCLVCDLIQRHDPADCTGLKGALMRLDGLVGPDGSTPREWRASFLKRSRARAALRRALSWQPERLVIAHGEWAPTDGTEMLRRGIRWLKP
ncbi:MAG: DUF4336 domain-containing protein [Planctomycetota bacterium]|jgi:hypothetical protein